MKRQKKRIDTRHTNNIWNGYDFAMSGLGEKSRLIGKIKHMKRCIRWSYQRIVRGYCDYDVWNMYGYLQELIPDMLQFLKDNRNGSPGYLGENYTNENGFLVNDTCHSEWDKILDHMIFLWNEMDEDKCSKKNPYEEEHTAAFSEFMDIYGIFGEKLQTEEELEANRRRGGGGTVHLMSEVPKYKDIDERYRTESIKLENYRNECKNEAFDLLKKYFYSLWD